MSKLRWEAPRIHMPTSKQAEVFKIPAVRFVNGWQLSMDVTLCLLMVWAASHHKIIGKPHNGAAIGPQIFWSVRQRITANWGVYELVLPRF